MPDIKSVDHLLNPNINEEEKVPHETLEEIPKQEDIVQENVSDIPPSEEVEEEIEKESSPQNIKKDTSDTDEYGNPVKKSKLYTEEQVQRIVRERLSRIKSSPPNTHSEIKETTQDFQIDNINPEDWEAQLNNFIDKRLEASPAFDKRLENKTAAEQRRKIEQEEQTIQMQFQEKFTAGVEKYDNFREVVAGKPITDAMMFATRGMDDPAAFIYAASKMQPKELERIANIRDPYQQAVEIGRLDSSLKKARMIANKSPRPLEDIKGDVVTKDRVNTNIDDRIHQYAKMKRK